MIRPALVAAVAAVVMGCGGGSPSAGTVDLEVYAAASLKPAMAKVKTAYEAANPGVMVIVSTDSSAALATKIEQGAPADVLLAADTANPQRLVDGGLASGGVTPFAGNVLTIVVPADNPAGIRTPADLARPGVRIVAAGDAVPVTGYATRLVDNLAGESGYPADFAAAYEANIVSEEDNVSGIVTKLELGEGDAGIVYVTDAASSGSVARIDVPAHANVQATYGGIVLNASPDQEAAAAFLAWLAGSHGRAVLAELGFTAPGP